MEVAHAEAGRSAPHGTAVVAVRQTAGRGTRGRLWSAERGGLWLSLVARPGRTEAPEALSLRIGLALAQLLEGLVPGLPTVGVKWPNDLMIGERKLAGVLSEARWAGTSLQWVVVGIGLNVSNPLPRELAGQATRLLDWDPSVTVDPLVAPVVACVSEATRDAGPLTTAELNAFAVRDVLTGRRMRAPVIGTADGITPTGALRVRSDSGPVHEILGGVVTTAG